MLYRIIVYTISVGTDRLLLARRPVCSFVPFIISLLCRIAAATVLQYKWINPSREQSKYFVNTLKRNIIIEERVLCTESSNWQGAVSLLIITKVIFYFLVVLIVGEQQWLDSGKIWGGEQTTNQNKHSGVKLYQWWRHVHLWVMNTRIKVYVCLSCLALHTF